MFVLLNVACPENGSSSFSDDRDMKHDAFIHYVVSGDSVIGLTLHLYYGNHVGSLITELRLVAQDYPINFANEIN